MGYYNKYWMVVSCLLILNVFGFTGGITAGEVGVKNSARPKVGLVLGGGGARGAAHMGVIRVLEEMNVPVDIVVGTSMGAIVGGMYASGFSPDDLEKLLDIDWDTAFKDSPPLEDLPFRRKQELQRYVFSNKLGFKKGKFVIPPGLIQGQTQVMILKSLTNPTYQITDFDDLALPFRAVATDIVKFKPVVIGEGDLATAIRASMTVPGVFAPVTYKGKLLVDGGLVNNVPADVAESLGAEVLIIVDVGSPYYTRERLRSVTGVTGQLSRHLVRENTEEQLERILNEQDTPSGLQGRSRLKSIVIKPELGDFSAMDFKNASKAVALGREAALAHEKYLGQLSVPEDKYRDWLKHQRRKPVKPPTIDYIEIKNTSGIRSSVIRRCLSIKAGDTLDVKTLETEISRIYGMGYFERIEYSLVETDGQTGLVIDVIEKSWGPDYLSFGFNISDDFDGNSDYNFRLNYTKTCINGYGAEWRNEVRLGEPAGFLTEFYQPLSHPLGFFVSPTYQYNDRKIDVYQDREEVARYRSKHHKARLDLGYTFGSFGEIRAGGIYEDGKLDVAIGDPGFQSFDYVRSGLGVIFDFDRADSTTFISHGSKVHIDYRADMTSMGSDDTVNTLKFEWNFVRSWGRYSFAPGIKVNTTLGEDNAPVQYISFLGGFLHLSGYARDEFPGSHTGLARLIMYRRMGEETARPFYLGCSAEAGNAWARSDDAGFDDLRTSGSVFVGKDTFLGHFYLSWGFAEAGRNMFHFSLGQMY